MRLLNKAQAKAPTPEATPEPDSRQEQSVFETKLWESAEAGEAAVDSRLRSELRLDDTAAEAGRLAYWAEAESCVAALRAEYPIQRTMTPWEQQQTLLFWQREVNTLVENALEAAQRRANAGNLAVGRLRRWLTAGRQQQQRLHGPAIPARRTLEDLGMDPTDPDVLQAQSAAANRPEAIPGSGPERHKRQLEAIQAREQQERAYEQEQVRLVQQRQAQLAQLAQQQQDDEDQQAQADLRAALAAEAAEAQ